MKKTLVILAVIMMGFVGVISYKRIEECVNRKEYNKNAESLYEHACKILEEREDVVILDKELYMNEDLYLEGRIWIEVRNDDGTLKDRIEIHVTSVYGYFSILDDGTEARS